MRKFLGFTILFVLMFSAVYGMGDKNRTALDFKVNTIEEKEVALTEYEGKVILLVNVASKCGLTPQYESLQKLYETYKDQGLIILGFPANNFKNQEPGTNEEILDFCSVNYNVTFPMFAKISVLGEDQHPLYQFLTSADTNEKFAGEIKWNFTKFLLDRRGQVIARFEPKVKPDSEEVLAVLEAALKTK